MSEQFRVGIFAQLRDVENYFGHILFPAKKVGDYLLGPKNFWSND